jgi:cbb3-type cytochrome oxidase subunit 3
MIEQELKNIWRNSSEAEQIKLDLSRLMIDLNNKMVRIEKAIRRRDLREIVAAIIVIPIFAYLAWAVPYPIAKVAAILTIVWAGYVIYKFKSVQRKRRKENFSLPFKDQLENQKANMMDQHRLLDTVLYWYVLPPFLLNMLFVWTLGYPSDITWTSGLAGHLPLETGDKLRFTIFLALFNVFIVWLNKRAVKKSLNPLIAEIEKIQQQLDSED